MDNNYNIFRRAAVGGFNRQDVITYIEKMRNEFFDYKQEVEQTVNQLNEKIRELESFCQVNDMPVEQAVEPRDFAENEETDAVNDINEATLKLRMVADDLCKSLCLFMEKVSENAISVVITEQGSDEENDLEAQQDENTECFEENDSDFANEHSEVWADKDRDSVIAENGSECETKEGVSQQEEFCPTDTVESILAFVESFSFDVKDEKATLEMADEKEKGDILDILDTVGFLI